MSSQLFAITGITGNVGGHAADALLSAGHRVRGIVRDKHSDSSKALKAKGVELAVATFTDSAALTKAFAGVDGVFVLSPPVYPSNEPRKLSLELTETLKQAVLAAKVPRVVLLSSIGAHIGDERIIGPIIKSHDLEQVFFPLTSQGVAVHSVRAGYFAENTLSAVSYAQTSSTFNALLPLDTSLPVIATKDIGIAVARLLTDKTSGLRILELEGPSYLTHHDIASAYFKLIGKTLPVAALPRETGESALTSAGLSQAYATWFLDMLASFTDGSLRYEGGHEHAKGTQTYEEFLADFLTKQQKPVN